MKENNLQTSRRHFLKATLTLPVALAAAPAAVTRAATAEDRPARTIAAAGDTPLPRRQLGRNGPSVTILALGGMEQALSPDYIDIAWSMGIRYFDTADCYLRSRSEQMFARWLAKYPERRKEIFLVSKDHPHQGPRQLLEMIDRRLEACGTKYLDGFFIHGIGTREYGTASLEWLGSDEFKKTTDQLKSSGKVKQIGFSCHDGRLNDYLNAAAQGGVVDIIMLRYTPFFPKGEAFDRALDAAHQAGIGLVAMKNMRNTSDVPKRMPEFDQLGLTTHQAVLHAVWSDPRISAACCQLENVGHLQDSTAAARSYKAPLKTAHVERLREIILASRRTMCPGCPSCDAFAANSDFALHDIARYVTYYEQDGHLGARELYRALPASARDATGVDLAALRDHCSFHVDYPEIVKRAERCFA
jgi:predicted aldo/keto reductase-like oxidoreductase